MSDTLAERIEAFAGQEEMTNNQALRTLLIRGLKGTQG